MNREGKGKEGRERGKGGLAEGEVEMPEGESGGDGNVEGVLGAFLGDFDAVVADVNNRLVYAVNLVAHNDCILAIAVYIKALQRDRPIDQF
jgi:hypothetical protein